MAETKAAPLPNLPSFSVSFSGSSPPRSNPSVKVTFKETWRSFSLAARSCGSRKPGGGKTGPEKKKKSWPLHGLSVIYRAGELYRQFPPIGGFVSPSMWTCLTAFGMPLIWTITRKASVGS